MISPYIAPGLSFSALHHDKSYEELLEIVCEIFQCKKIPVNRKREIVEPRQAAWYCLRLCNTEERKITYQMIADSFGTDHANVYSGVKNVKNLLESDKKFRVKYVSKIQQFKI